MLRVARTIKSGRSGMANEITMQTFKDDRGSLTVVEKILPFEIKRVYYIYNLQKLSRGRHRHKKNIQALICIRGSCRIYCHNGEEEKEFVVLDSPDKGLIVEPRDWHEMVFATKDSILLVLASEYFDADDYIDEIYD